MCYFFKKNLKNLLQFIFEKNNLLCKKEKKNYLSLGNPPQDIKWSVPYCASNLTSCIHKDKCSGISEHEIKL